MKKILALLLAATMLLPTEALAAVSPQSKEPPSVVEYTRPEQMIGSDFEKIELEDPYSPDEMVTAIIELEEPPISVASQGPDALRNERIQLKKQKSVERQISTMFLDGQELEISQHYTEVINGFAAEVPYGTLDDIRTLDDVARVYVAPTFKVAPDMPTRTTVMGGMENGSGYLGEGMVIAIVDSGLELTHPAFAAAPNGASLDQAAIADVLSTQALKAEESYSVQGELTASQVYHGGKVPFAYDYADKDTDVNPGKAGDHGTHVAGIASANSGVTADVVGVAPEAQLLIMKVFSSYGNGLATWDSILAAMDDAVALGADVINLSLGSTCGFADYSWEEGVADTLNRVSAAGVSLSVACGNEYSAAFYNRLGKSHALTQNPDYGTVASPSCYEPSLAVASVEKKASTLSSYLMVGERKVAYNDITEAPNVDIPAAAPSLKSLGTGVELPFVVVPGIGEATDYEGLDVTGKIVLVSRGTTSYEAKKNAAKAAGASAILVYNNEPGMSYMQMDTYDLPSAFLSQTDGKALAALPEAERKLTIAPEKAEIDNPASGLMSDFSSWGVTPELTLKPDITAPGGNIKSTVTNGGYDTKSGTSMAAPFVSGSIAVTKQYVEQQHPQSDPKVTCSLVDALLMSTAEPVLIDGAPYSPRKQGAGLINVDHAVASPAYLTVNGGRPKAALGDDVRKSGVYTLSFEVHNWSDAPVTYTLGGTVQTDGMEVTKQLKGQDVHQVTELPHLLDASIDARTVTVAPGTSETVSVTVTLTAADKAYLDQNFENGSYVEGFVTLTPADGGVTLSLPYMGFYGDWTRASVMDRGYFWNDLKDEANWASQYTNTAAASSLEGTVDTYLGDNPYHRGIPYLADRSAISPNGDDYMDKLDILYTGLLRNVATLNYTIADAANPDKVYYSQDMDHVSKSVYSGGYFRIVPAGVDDYTKITPWDGKDHGISLPNNSKVLVTVSATLPYDKHPVNNECLSWSFPITIDTEEPAINSVKVREENGKFFVDLSVSDNQYVSNIAFADASGDKLLQSFPVAEDEAGMTSELSFDVTGLGQKLTLVVNDYASNRRETTVLVDGNVDESQVIVPTKTVFTEDFETETFPANGWELKSQSAKTWYQGSEYGSRMAMCAVSRSEQQNEWLISPVIDLSAQDTNAGMVFDFYANYFWSVEQHDYNLKVKASTNGQDWEDIWQLWDVKNEFGPWEKTQAKVIIPEKFQNASSVQFAIVYEGMDGTEAWVDNVQVYVDDPTMVHTITATAGEGGTISPEGTVKISDKMNRTFTITPNAGYIIADVKVDGKSVGPRETYSFEKVTADHTIEAVFSAEQGGDTTILINENFEDEKMPDDWTLQSTNQQSTWKVQKYYGNWGAYSTWDSYDPDPSYNQPGNLQDEYLILPAQNLSGRDAATLSFQFTANKRELKNGNMTATVEITDNQGNTWKEIWNGQTCADSLKEGVISDYVGTGDQTVQIPAEYLKDGVQIAFRYQHPARSSDGGPVFVDNVKLMANGGSTPEPDPQPPVSSDLINEDFEKQTANGALPDGWTLERTNTSSTWKMSKYAGSMTAYVSDDWTNYAKQDERLLTPAVDLSGGNAEISFRFVGGKYPVQDKAFTLTLEGRTAGGSWQQLWSSADEKNYTPDGDYRLAADVTLKVPAELQTAGAQFAFRYVRPAGESTAPCSVDNVVVTAAGGTAPDPEPQPEPPVCSDLLNEDFESHKLSDGWEIRTTNTGSYNTWKIKSSYSQWGAGVSPDTYDPYDPEFYPGNAQDELLITPALSLAGKTGTISFQLSSKITELKRDGMTVTVEASTDGTSWTPIWNAKDHADELKSGVIASNVETADFTVEIPADFQKDGVQFAFRYVRPARSEDGGVAFIDNVKVTAAGSTTPDPEPQPEPPVSSDLLNENFEGQKMPDGWTVQDNNSSYTWKIKKYLKDHWGAYCDADLYEEDPWGGGWSLEKGAKPMAGAKQDERLVTPALALNGKTGTLSFQFTASKNCLKRNEMTVTVEASSDDGKTWTELWNAKNALDLLKEGYFNDYAGTGDIVLEIPAEFRKDGVKFAFRYQRPAASVDGGPVFVDNVVVTAQGGTTPEPPATEFIISASAGQGGNIDPRGDVTVQKGASQTFTINASASYEIRDVLVDGVSVGKVSAYTFEKVDKPHTIEAVFEKIPEVLPTAVHEDFNNGLPEKWLVEGPSASGHYETWKPGTLKELNRTGSMICTQNFMNYQQNEYLILPEIQMDKTAVLSFDWAADHYHLSNGMTELTLEVSLDKGSHWTPLWIAAEHIPNLPAEEMPQYLTGSARVEIPVNFCVPGARFAFVFTSYTRGDGAAAIDNVNLAPGGETPAPSLYAITVAKMAHGTVTPSKTVAQEGDVITLTVSPETGYRLKEGSLVAGDIVVTGSSFTMPGKAVEITALFEKIPEVPEKPVYKDGVYEGEAQGKGGKVKVSVTVTNGAVASVEVQSQNETPEYWIKAQKTLDDLKGKNSKESIEAVDTHTGATISSTAIKNATLNALAKAVETDSGIFASGEGTEANPWIIHTVTQLTDFAASVNGGENYKGKFIALDADLDLAEVAWVPIGTSDHDKYTGFSGVFDGQNHIVSHVNIGSRDIPAAYEALGFFGVIDGGIVRNLNLTVDQYFNSVPSSAAVSDVWMGGLAGILARNGSVDHCTVTTKEQMSISDISGRNGAIGGLVGKMNTGSVIANCWTNANLSYSSGAFEPRDAAMGGICGLQAKDSLIANSASFGIIPGLVMMGVLRIGGLVGHTSGSIYNCYTTSTTKANVLLGDGPDQAPVATTAIGHLVGSSTAESVLYQCCYNQDAKQFSNVDLAADPAEGKTERRQAVGWDPVTKVKADLTHVTPCTSVQLTSAAFADTMNSGLKTVTVNSADTYFGGTRVADAQAALANGFTSWELQNSMVLPAGTQKLDISVADIAILSDIIVGKNTSLQELGLPATISVTLNNGLTTEVPVTWNTEGYTPDVATTYTFVGTLNLPANITNPNRYTARITVIVQEDAPAAYSITVGNMANGTVVPGKSAARAGETVSLTVKPAAGYQLQIGSLKGNGKVIPGTSFTMPAEDVTITAVFEEVSVPPADAVYKDGVYVGQAQGRGGIVKVRVTVTNGAVAFIDVLDQTETPDYWVKARKTLADLIGKNDKDSIDSVDTKTGATISSTAIKEAVQNALEKALPSESGIFASGDGTLENPYLIETVSQLTSFAASVNQGENYKGQYIALNADLDLAELVWVPIGTSAHEKYTGFAGTFDGRNHTVSHITCGTGQANVSYEAIGFFGVIENGGVVRDLNLQIEKFYNTCTTGAAKVYSGGLVGILDRNATVDHCTVSGADQAIVEGSGIDGAVGAVAGKMLSGSVISNCWTDVGLSVGTYNPDPLDISMGGICGQQEKNSLIVNCTSRGSVPGTIMTGVLQIGGLVGKTSGAIYNCYTTSLTKANVLLGDATTAIGHLVGCSETGAALYQCYYDKNAPQFSNVDLAGEPAEGKPERRQAAGWDAAAQIRTDLSHVTACDKANMTTSAFADTMNSGLTAKVMAQADAYFAEHDLLNTVSVIDAEGTLLRGYNRWKLTGSIVLPESAAEQLIYVDDVAIQQDLEVPFGTLESKLDLPETVSVTLSNGTQVNMPVTWTCEGYQPEIAGRYTFTGKLTLPDGVLNPNHFGARLVVTVQGSETDADKEAAAAVEAKINLIDEVITLDSEPQILAARKAYNALTDVQKALVRNLFVLTDAEAKLAELKKDEPSKPVVPGGGSSAGGNDSDREVIKNPDGSKTTIETKKDGTVIETTTTPNGTTVEVTRPVTGNEEVQAEISKKDASDAETSGKPVELPMAPVAAGEKSPVIHVKNPGKKPVLVTVPVKNATAGTVAVIVRPDGTQEVIRKTALSKNGVTFPVAGQADIRIVDNTRVFTDVPSGFWAEDAISFVTARGIYNGTTATEFAPNVGMTRGMLAKVLHNLENNPVAAAPAAFTDVPADFWCADAIAWAAEQGIVGGYADGTFRANQIITREQLVTMLYRYAGAPASGGCLLQYPDAASVSGFAADAMCWAVENGILSGTAQGTLNPQGTATRAQVATFLTRFLNR